MLNGPYVPRRGKPEGSGLDIDKAEVVEVLFYLLAECIIRFQLLFQPYAGLPDTRIAQPEVTSDTL